MEPAASSSQSSWGSSLSTLSTLSSTLSSRFSQLKGKGAETTEAKNQILGLWTSCKPWKEFMDGKRMRTPTSGTEVQERLVDNLSYFSNNYIICFILLSSISILIHPMSFLCILLLLMLYVFLFLNQADSNEISLAGLRVKGGHKVKVGLYAVIAFVLLYLSDAVGVIGSWTLFGVLLSFVHAAFRISVKEPDFECPVVTSV